MMTFKHFARLWCWNITTRFLHFFFFFFLIDICFVFCDLFIIKKINFILASDLYDVQSFAEQRKTLLALEKEDEEERNKTIENLKTALRTQPMRWPKSLEQQINTLTSTLKTMADPRDEKQRNTLNYNSLWYRASVLRLHDYQVSIWCCTLPRRSK